VIIFIYVIVNILHLTNILNTLMANNSENLSKELNNLNELLKSGVLTKEEFEKAKKKILDN